MRRYLLALSLIGFAALLLADSKNPADYPLRIHIFGRTETTFYHMRATEEAKGEGRANLFENGGPRGVDFQFECPKRLMNSSGYETFPARWKKPNQELVILVPEFGKQNSYYTCRLQVQMKDFAYIRHNGVLGSEPIAVYKEWMTKHDYDPEHGKEVPTPTRSCGSTRPSTGHRIKAFLIRITYRDLVFR